LDSTDQEDAVRVVLTGHTPSGQGAVVRDSRVGLYPVRAAGYSFYNLWGADMLPSFPDDGLQSTATELAPAIGGLRLVKLLVEPDGAYDFSDQPGQAPESTEGVHLAAAANSQVHYTPTIDLLVVLDGEVWLELDGGQEVHLRKGDFAIQNGTRHAWRNHGTKTAEVAVAVVGVDHAGFPGA
jgi:quercetin dioxygenase-like cupin family protein